MQRQESFLKFEDQIALQLLDPFSVNIEEQDWHSRVSCDPHVHNLSSAHTHTTHTQHIHSHTHIPHTHIHKYALLKKSLSVIIDFYTLYNLTK